MLGFAQRPDCTRGVRVSPLAHFSPCPSITYTADKLQQILCELVRHELYGHWLNLFFDFLARPVFTGIVGKESR